MIQNCNHNLVAEMWDTFKMSQHSLISTLSFAAFAQLEIRHTHTRDPGSRMTTIEQENFLEFLKTFSTVFVQGVFWSTFKQKWLLSHILLLNFSLSKLIGCDLKPICGTTCSCLVKKPCLLLSNNFFQETSVFLNSGDPGIRIFFDKTNLQRHRSDGQCEETSL